MPYVEVDVDLDEFYDDLSDWEKDELVEKLIKDGYQMKDPNRDYEEEYGDEEFTGSLHDIEWSQMITKINTARYQLTAEQEKMLVDLAKSL